MAKRITFGLVAVLAVYLAFSFSRGLDILKAGGPELIVLGLCVMIIPIIGGYLVYREIQFGAKSSLLGAQIEQSLLPTKEIKPRSDEARRYLDESIERTKQAPTLWVNWFCVAIGYDLIGQRKLARESMYHALELHEELQTHQDG